ncbi:NAD(P)H-binding protein [Campylobacter sp. RM9344]|uniref:NAD(P)H-binding protein n=1 Tax=Campylobacter californiensis TaxID=1032243 RepID=A0AAW3ZUR7_9BACT|nr:MULTISPECIES: NAD(P)H-binding protein [unclassified Campylobacter]MBE2984969.1 NAD(P)H-binding protein [Campylobacter sp. RM6883]MBE2995411.1 NAD(P)H-binding protein [Campylobacter sp. RM6913]MBE3030333.1 NAD(P)H-binding protein [Campylobacter sp. RM9344]MBE3608612.1 NAD(P)H-binding protein [Campylobacter sp. RM9337]QCD49968.1 atypical short-chain dehydrogenase/reductase [Campylobacter sp. RM6914]
MNEKIYTKTTKIALVVGATGVVGREIVAKLLADESYEKVIVWVRRELNFTHEKLEVRLVNFDEISAIPHEKVDEVFCALGTTMKQAGSKEAFLKVDVEYVKESAKWAKNAGAGRFLLVSAQGADKNSWFFYNRTKAQAQDAVIEQNFAVTQIFAPPIIKGERKDERTGEKFSIWLFELFPKSWFSAYPMTGKEIAQKIVEATKLDVQGVKFYTLRASEI